MASKMTQREAIRWRKRARDAEQMLRKQRISWASEWPNGTCIGGFDVTADVFAAVKTARKLKHAVVVADTSVNYLALFGLPLPEPQ